MNIQPICALDDNYIWAITANNVCVVVDPGEAAPVQAWLAMHSLRLGAILLTHRHGDHTGGVEQLISKNPIPVYGSSQEANPHCTHFVDENSVIDIPEFNISFRVWAIPGHTEGHIAYLQKDRLFCGDTLFAGGCGKVLGGTIAQLFTSVSRLKRLPPETKIYCAHEYTLSNLLFALHINPNNAALITRQKQCAILREAQRPTVPSTIAEELATNPFMRCNDLAVRTSAENFAGCALESEFAVFEALRHWKNVFKAA